MCLSEGQMSQNQCARVNGLQVLTKPLAKQFLNVCFKLIQALTRIALGKGCNAGRHPVFIYIYVADV